LLLILLLLFLRKDQKQKLWLKEQLESRIAANVGAEHLTRLLLG